MMAWRSSGGNVIDARILMPSLKKLKDTMCVYCATRSATTKDHIFARGFFLEARRGNLPKVPACQPCNEAKAGLEHYLATVLPFAGRHADAPANLQEMVRRRLDKNRRLHRTLAAGMSRTWTREAGVYMPTSTLPFEPEKLEELFAFIAKGLTWHHWGVLITANTDVWAGILNGSGERLLTSWMAPARVRVTRNLGGGTFSYEGVQASDNPCMTIWMFSIYDGVRLRGDPDAPHEEVSKVGAVTGSTHFMDQFRKMIGEPAVT
jgi:hypothetical protein